MRIEKTYQISEAIVVYDTYIQVPGSFTDTILDAIMLFNRYLHCFKCETNDTIIILIILVKYNRIQSMH